MKKDNILVIVIVLIAIGVFIYTHHPTVIRNQVNEKFDEVDQLIESKDYKEAKKIIGDMIRESKYKDYLHEMVNYNKVINKKMGKTVKSEVSSISSTEHYESNANRETDAWICAKKCVQDNLKTPSTADFPSYSKSYVSFLGNSKYKISAYVDAENGFGAMIRSDFTVTLELTSSGFKNATVSIQ